MDFIKLYVSKETTDSKEATYLMRGHICKSYVKINYRAYSKLLNSTEKLTAHFKTMQKNFVGTLVYIYMQMSNENINMPTSNPKENRKYKEIPPHSSEWITY